MESGDTLFPEMVGLMTHGLNGTLIIPILALALLITSFFAKVPSGVPWAALVFGLVALQVLLGFGGYGLSFLGALHGLNALLLLGATLTAAHKARKATAPPSETQGQTATTPV